jgi:Ni/Fe-hydrogenase subunit HybB-like protein
VSSEYNEHDVKDWYRKALRLHLLLSTPINARSLSCTIYHLLTRISYATQAIKIYDVFRYLFFEEDVATNFLSKWLFVDFAYCTTLSLLRIPRLNYTRPMIFLQMALLWLIDGLLFGGVDDGLTGRSRLATYRSHRLPGAFPEICSSKS